MTSVTAVAPYRNTAAFDGSLGSKDKAEGKGATFDAREDAGRRPQLRPPRSGKSNEPPSLQATALHKLTAKLTASGLPYTSEASAEAARARKARRRWRALCNR